VACGLLGSRGRVRVRVTRPRADTVRFAARASAHRCVAQGTPGVVLVGSNGGNGVLLLLRWSESLGGGEWPLLQRGDTASRAGAIVGVRFMSGNVARGVPLDSGTVSVRRQGAALSLDVRGSGVEVTGATHAMVDMAFEAVPLAPDTVPCQVQL
jgi:hypothetical protein